MVDTLVWHVVICHGGHYACPHSLRSVRMAYWVLGVPALRAGFAEGSPVRVIFLFLGIVFGTVTVLMALPFVILGSWPLDASIGSGIPAVWALLCLVLAYASGKRKGRP